MSRGGRGGGRGGWGGGGGGAGSRGSVPQFAINSGLTLSALGDKRGAGESRATLASGDPTKDQVIVRGGLGLYPPYPNLPRIDPPTDEERRVLKHARRLAQVQRNSPYRLVSSDKKSDLEFYRDKYNSEQNMNVHHLDADRLFMKQEFFPERLWAGYFEPQKKMIQNRIAQKRKRAEDIDENEDPDDPDKASSRSGQSDEEGFADMDDDDEEQEGDYGNQYFDNGEGDDGDDLGGGGGDGGGGGGDDD